MVKAPVLVIAIGNLSRGDDALGPLLAEQIAENHDPQLVEVISDFQLQIEYALDLLDRQTVLFVDAGVGFAEPYQLTRLQPQTDHSYTSHALSPAALLAVYQTTLHVEPPTCFLLAIQGVGFELGASLSETATHNLAIALDAAQVFLQQSLLGLTTQ